ncbi:hypothetical protein PYV02_04490 [Leifsonia sp. H3M29-4]|uniref:hypothetical protein n=1 Tax=Salinibacterium metalliresistens TaxID=3031321 RepID=UPI0023DB6394|nr:hypothetical protein [Salinibacterium metalliresistens]MDF1478336.1 hypothetical protein [Salinibacterium metalliresistens]
MTASPEIVTSPPVEQVRPGRLWPLWGVVAGILGFAATVLLDTRPAGELAAAENGEPYLVGPDSMAELDRMTNYLGFLVGFAAVAALLVFQAGWKRWVENRYLHSVAARVVSGGVVVTAAGLALAYGWKGALANYGYGGSEFGLFDDQSLLIYYMLTDFGPYIPWLGVLIAAGAVAWMAWRERLISRVLGTLSGLYFLLIAVAYGITGVPGLAGPGSGLWLAFACIWLAVGRSRITRELTA